MFDLALTKDNESLVYWFSSDLDGSWSVYQGKQLAGSLHGDFNLFFWFVLL